MLRMGDDKIIVRVPRENTLVCGDVVWASLGEREDVIRQMLMASVNEGRFVVREDEQEGEES